MTARQFKLVATIIIGLLFVFIVYGIVTGNIQDVPYYPRDITLLGK